MLQVSLSFKDRVLSIYTLDRHKSFVIGHHPDCQICIDSLAVSPRHAKITYQDKSFVIDKLDDDANILINNKEIESQQHLSDGDQISLGKHTLTFSFNEKSDELEHKEVKTTSESSVDSGTGWIQYLNGHDMGKTIQIKKNMSNISDHQEKNIAMISHRTDGFYISYLKGDKPPLVNNESIGEKSIQLTNKSKISLGAQDILFYIN